MLRSIATVSISGTLPEKLHAIAAAGYQGVEIFENDLLYYTGTPAEIRQLAADLGLKITLFQPFRDFEGASRAQFAANIARARRKFALMHELGCDTLLLCSNVQPDCSADSELQVADLRALATLAELPYSGPRRHAGRATVGAGGENHLCSARRCAVHENGSPGMESPFPLLPRAGRAAAGAVCRAGHPLRLSRPLVAGDL